MKRRFALPLPTTMLNWLARTVVDMAIKFRVGIGTIGYLHSYKHKEPIMSLYLYIFDLVPILVSMSMSTINLTLPTYVVC